MPPPSNYYYTQSAAYPYGAPNAAPSYYDLYPPNAAGYLSRPPNPPNNQLSHPNADAPYSSYAPNGNPMNNGRAPGTMGEDGLWYPFAEAQKDAYSTPKKGKGSKKGGNKGGKKAEDKEMSPGRRVNQIQKQLEYYFSPANLDADEFLQSAMDAEGWVRIDVLIPFARMKVLGATKELVIEAAFHSTVIEIDHVAQDKVRMTAQWKAYCENREKAERAEKAAKAKKRSKGSKEREREKLIQSELDNAEVTESTIDAIVALVEKKQERRAKRRELREREKAKRKLKEENDGEETKTAKSEATEELIQQDRAEAEAKNAEAKNAEADADADSKGDPDNNDMVEID